MNQKKALGHFLPKMGNYLRIKKNSLVYLVVGFILTLVVLGISFLLSHQRLNALIAYSDQVEKTYQVIEKIEILSNKAKDAETAVRGYALTKDSSYLAPLILARLEMPVILDSLKSWTSESEMQQVRLALMRNTLKLRMKILEDAITSINDGTYQDVLLSRMEKGKEMMENFRNELEIFRKEEKTQLQERFNQKQTYQRLTPNMFRQLTILVVLVSVVLFILLLLELNRRLSYQKALQQQLDLYKQTNDELTQLAYAVAHDLQEPVRKMRIFTDRFLIKQKELLQKEELMILEKIDLSAFRLQGLLEDISNYMDLISNKEQKNFTDLNKILQDLIRKKENEIQQSRATIQINKLPELPAYPNQLQLLFLALLDNSLKFSKPGIPQVITVYSELLKGKQLKTFISKQVYSSYWVIHFKDEGIGFDIEYRHKIFQLFRRLHNQDEFTGKGLGLALCLRIMSNHQGFINVESKIGEGACFMLFFPVN